MLLTSFVIGLRYFNNMLFTLEVSHIFLMGNQSEQSMLKYVGEKTGRSAFIEQLQGMCLDKGHDFNSTLKLAEEHYCNS